MLWFQFALSPMYNVHAATEGLALGEKVRGCMDLLLGWVGSQSSGEEQPVEYHVGPTEDRVHGPVIYGRMIPHRGFGPVREILVSLHGNGDSPQDMSELNHRLMEALPGSGREVLSLGLPFHGRDLERYAHASRLSRIPLLIPFQDTIFQITQAIIQHIEQLDQSQPPQIRFVGHSLGGAVATLSALQLMEEGYSVRALHLIAPFVTDFRNYQPGDFAARYEAVLSLQQQMMGMALMHPLTAWSSFGSYYKMARRLAIAGTINGAANLYLTRVLQRSQLQGPAFFFHLITATRDNIIPTSDDYYRLLHQWLGSPESPYQYCRTKLPSGHWPQRDALDELVAAIVSCR